MTDRTLLAGLVLAIVAVLLAAPVIGATAAATTGQTVDHQDPPSPDDPWWGPHWNASENATPSGPYMWGGYGPMMGWAQTEDGNWTHVGPYAGSDAENRTWMHPYAPWSQAPNGEQAPATGPWGYHMGPGYGMGPMGPGYGFGPMGPGYGFGPQAPGAGQQSPYGQMGPGHGPCGGMGGWGQGYAPNQDQDDRNTGYGGWGGGHMGPRGGHMRGW